MPLLAYSQPWFNTTDIKDVATRIVEVHNDVVPPLRVYHGVYMDTRMGTRVRHCIANESLVSRYHKVLVLDAPTCLSPSTDCTPFMLPQWPLLSTSRRSRIRHSRPSVYREAFQVNNTYLCPLLCDNVPSVHVVSSI